MRGLARELVRSYAEKETGKRKRLVLTCLENLVGMYQKFGFSDAGESASVWGGERWHEMVLLLPEQAPASASSDGISGYGTGVRAATAEAQSRIG